MLPGANRTVDRAYLEEHRGLLEDCDILAMQLEIPLDTVLYAAKEAKALGKTVVLDPAPAVPDLPEELFQTSQAARIGQNWLARGDAAITDYGLLRSVDGSQLPVFEQSPEQREQPEMGGMEMR